MAGEGVGRLKVHICPQSTGLPKNRIGIAACIQRKNFPWARLVHLPLSICLSTPRYLVSWLGKLGSR